MGIFLHASSARGLVDFRPVNLERPLKGGDKNRELVSLVAVNPPSVVCEESIFVNAVTTFGVPLVSFFEEREEKNGDLVRSFFWHLERVANETAVPRYTLKQLAEWWESPEWLRANPTHELAIAKSISVNLMRFAERARTQPALVKITKGKRFVQIPTNATEERRQELLKTLDE